MTTQQPKSHMRIVLSVFWVFVLINIVVLGWFFMTKSPWKISPLFSYVDKNVQQVVLLQSDKVLDLLGDEVASASANPIYQVLLDSNNLWLLQFAQDTWDIRSAILVDGTKNFEPNQFLSVINQQDDTDYSYHKYDKDIYIFATPDTIDQLTSAERQLLINTDGFNKIKPLVVWQDIVVISRVDPNAAPIADENIAQFVSRSDAFVIGLSLQKDWLNLDAHLIYKEATTWFVSYTFTPSLTDSISDQTMAFVETNAAWLRTQNDKDAVISWFRAYDPEGIYDLSDDDIREMVSSNIALIAQNSATFSDLRLGMIMWTQKAYPIIQSIFPLFQEPLANLVGLDPSMLQAVQESDSISYQATMFGLVPMTLQAYQTDEETIVSLWASAKIEQSNTHKNMAAPKGSIAYLYVQFDPILQLYRQFWTMMGQNVQDPFFLQQEKLLKGKVWEWYVQSTADSLSLHSVIK